MTHLQDKPICPGRAGVQRHVGPVVLANVCGHLYLLQEEQRGEVAPVGDLR